MLDRQDARWAGKAALAILITAPMATGCASRTAPFNDLDKAQVTIMKLQQYQPPQQPAQPAQPAIPAIPGIPPELQQLGQQVLQQVGPLLPPGVLPPGTIPGQQPAQPQPQAPPPRLYQNQWVIAQEVPLMDDAMREQLLDLFGDEGSFNAQRGNCFTPGMAVSFRSPTKPEPVDVVLSFSCNQAVGYGFTWPYNVAGFTPETHAALSDIYQRIFGTPVPQGGA
jgi:hypothetical protein